MANQNDRSGQEFEGEFREGQSEALDGGEQPLDAPPTPEKEQNQLEGQLEEMEKKSIEFKSKADSLGLLPDSIETEDPIDLSHVPYSPFYNILDKNETSSLSEIICSPTKRKNRLAVINEQLAEPKTQTSSSDLLKEKQALLVAQGFVDTFLMRSFVVEEIRRQSKIFYELRVSTLSDVAPSNREMVDKTIKNRDEIIKHQLQPFIDLSQTSETYFATIIPESLKRFERDNPDIATPFLKSANEAIGKAIGVETREIGLLPSDQEEQHTLQTFIDQLNLENMPQTLADFKKWLNELEAEIPESITDTTPPSDPSPDQLPPEGEVVVA